MPGPRLIPSFDSQPRIRPSAEEDALVDFFNRGSLRRPSRNFEGTDLPYVPHPGIFQPDPFVSGPPELAQAARRLMDRTPSMKENVSGIQTGPTRSVLDYLRQSEFDAEDYPNSNLLGAYGIGAHDISLNPRLFADTQEHGDDINYQNTLTHEFGHAAGYKHMGDKPGGAEEGPRIAPYQKLGYPQYENLSKEMPLYEKISRLGSILDTELKQFERRKRFGER